LLFFKKYALTRQTSLPIVADFHLSKTYEKTLRSISRTLFGCPNHCHSRRTAARSTLKGSKPSWAAPKNYASAANATDKLGFRVYLGWNNPSGAEALARAVSDPQSKSYRHYLTPAQFRQQFAPTATQVAQVQSWLTSQGFSLVYTPANNHYVSAQGTVAQAQAAFNTSFGLYNVSGMTLRSPSADVSIPSSLAGVVNGVIGLDQSYAFVHPNLVADGNAPPSGGFRNAPPLSTFWAEFLTGATPLAYQPPAAPGYSFPSGFTDVALPSVPWSEKGHTPAQIKGVYGISSSYDGTGQTVAIIDAYASPTIVSDVNQWSANRGLPTLTAGQLVQVVPPGIYNTAEGGFAPPFGGPRHDPQGWYGEETLDVEAVHGMAPNANIVYVAGPNNEQDLDVAMNYVVDNRLARIVSNSYGFLGESPVPAGYILPFEQTLMQGAIEGIGIYFSSGDNGDETATLGFAEADWPASSPWVTAVGGTSLGVTSGNTRAVETGWDTNTYSCNKTSRVCTDQGFLYGSGGGESQIFAKPAYQTTYGGNLTGFTGRGVPDVAAVGDPNTGYLVGQTQTFPATCLSPGGAFYDEYRVGGTSLSCPLVAGIMALSDQKSGVHGFANPFFYALALSSPSSFNDVLSVKTAVARRNFNNGVDDCDGTVDRLRTFDDDTESPTQSTGPGWDNVTGLGVFNGIP
jgi:subtilase family serine protease